MTPETHKPPAALMSSGGFFLVQSAKTGLKTLHLLRRDPSLHQRRLAGRLL